MLTTVAPFVVGAAALGYAGRTDGSPTVTIQARGAVRDLRVFLFGFGVVLVTVFVSSRRVLLASGALVVAVYGWYLYRTMESGLAGSGSTEVEPLEVGKLLDWTGVGRSNHHHAEEPGDGLIALQTLLAVGLILVGSGAFVAEIEWFSAHVLATPALVTALLAAPLASNVPEGIDGLIWIARGRDTLAVDQIAGTLAFQGTVLAALGIVFTPWSIESRWGTVGFLTATAIVGARHGRRAVLPRPVVRRRHRPACAGGPRKRLSRVPRAGGLLRARGIRGVVACRNAIGAEAGERGSDQVRRFGLLFGWPIIHLLASS
jgi:cation:H+ antiporter